MPKSNGIPNLSADDCQRCTASCDVIRASWCSQRPRNGKEDCRAAAAQRRSSNGCGDTLSLVFTAADKRSSLTTYQCVVDLSAQMYSNDSCAAIS
ncbi:hypothetical protein J6590_073292 [Homalodisca vitripennis]|nr:hypothetical protein J6590_073292 [Homalodisca vitripennis]